MKKNTKKMKVEKKETAFIDTSSIDNSLNEKAKLFCFYFSFPGTPAFGNKAQAAVSAGYGQKNSKISGYKLFKNPKVQKECARLQKDFLTAKIDELYNRYLSTLEQRSFYDVSDFYEADGEKMKKLSDIAEEKRIAIDAIDFKQVGTIFMFGDRKIALREIKDIHRELHPDKNLDEQEETREIIMEHIILKEKKRKENAEFLEAVKAEILEPTVLDLDDDK